MRLLLSGLALAIAVGGVRGLLCYSCIKSAGDDNDLCITNPDLVTNSNPKVVCKPEMKYCTIRRQEIISTGEVNTFYRGCEEKPDYLNDVITDEQFKTYFRSCKTNLCNVGDGIKNIGGGGDGPNRDPGAEGSLVVPGIGAAATASATFFLVAVAMLLSYILSY